MGKLTNIILLNRRSIKLFSKFLFLYSYVTLALKSLQKSLFVQRNLKMANYGQPP